MFASANTLVSTAQGDSGVSVDGEVDMMNVVCVWLCHQKMEGAEDEKIIVSNPY